MLRTIFSESVDLRGEVSRMAEVGQRATDLALPLSFVNIDC
jgi:hypothetical protein